jgi:hypothetical protein
MNVTTTNELDFNTAGPQKTFDVIPANTICELQMKIRYGGAGSDDSLTRATDGNSEGLDCEFTVTKPEQYAGRKLWQRFTLHGTTQGHAEAGEISRNTLRAILESARGIKPDDQSDAANAARKIKGYCDFDGLKFTARLGVRPPQGNYAAKNTVLEVITPERQGWTKPEQVQTNSPTPTAPTTPPANAVARPTWGTS